MRPLPTLLVWLACVLSLSARAADRPEVLRQGFSSDGRFHLLLTAWTQDGSGFPQAALQITDVWHNRLWSLVTLGGQAQEGRRPEDLAARLLVQERRQLSARGLARPLPGQRLYVDPQAASVPRTGNIHLALAGRPQALRLGNELVPRTCAHSDPRGEPVGLLLSLGRQVLQRDARLPRSRACVYGYRIESVWRSGPSLVVVLRTFAPGFEGPDTFPMVVGGRWP